MRIRPAGGLVPFLPDSAERPGGAPVAWTWEATPDVGQWSGSKRRMRVLELRMKKQEDRLRRQFEAIERKAPVGGRFLNGLRVGRYRLVRIPLAVLLVLGGVAGFLPILGFWMVPLGFLLLAIDVPALRGCVSAGIILVRRRLDIWRRRWRRWRSG